MRGIVSYLLAGILAVLVTDFVVLPVDFGLEVRAGSVGERSATTQFADRTHKGDRLSPPTSGGMQQTPTAMIGCDPPFSLLGAAHANTPGRCIADTAHPLAE